MDEQQQSDGQRTPPSEEELIWLADVTHIPSGNLSGLPDYEQVAGPIPAIGASVTAGLSPEVQGLPPGYEPAAGPVAAGAAPSDAWLATGSVPSEGPQGRAQLQQAIASGQFVPLNWHRRADRDAAPRIPTWRLRFRVWMSSHLSMSGLPSRERLEQYRLRKFEKTEARLSELLNQDGISQEERNEIHQQLTLLNEGSDSEAALSGARDFLIERVPQHGDASKIRKAIKLLALRADQARNMRAAAERRRAEAERRAREGAARLPEIDRSEPLPLYDSTRDSRIKKILSDNIFVLQKSLDKIHNATMPSSANIALHEEYIAVLLARLNGKAPPPTTIEDDWEEIEAVISQMSEVDGNDEDDQPPTHPQSNAPASVAGPSTHKVRSVTEEAGMFFKSLSDLPADDRDYMRDMYRLAQDHLARLGRERGGPLPDGYAGDFWEAVAIRAREKIAASTVNKGKERADNRNPGEGS
jgi:hypothetical protein